MHFHVTVSHSFFIYNNNFYVPNTAPADDAKSHGMMLREKKKIIARDGHPMNSLPTFSQSGDFPFPPPNARRVDEAPRRVA